MLKVYLIVCIYNIVMFTIYMKSGSSSSNKTSDIDKSMEEFKEALNQLKAVGCMKLACAVENIINSYLDGNKKPLYLLTFAVLCTPIIHLLLTIVVTNEVYKKIISN